MEKYTNKRDLILCFLREHLTLVFLMMICQNVEKNGKKIKTLANQKGITS